MALVLLALCSPLAQAETLAAFDLANKLYEQGKYLEAVSAYESLARSGKTSAALYYNLGNALIKSGQIGRALAAYRQAGQVMPRDPDLRANVQFARNQVQGPTLSPNRWQRWLGRLTLNEWTLLASGAVWLWLLLLALRQLRPALRAALGSYVIWLGLAAVLLCGCGGAAFYEARITHVAIVIDRDAPVRQGPLEESATAFTVHDGAELRVLDQKDDWFQVATDPRRIGWVRRNQVLLVPQGQGTTKS
jgi:tetratricopeptide (TPR) repeat protein